jgi:diguanylate cyclase (GGDEF)-like protein
MSKREATEQRQRVLLIDDDPAIWALARRALREVPVEVFSEESGERALGRILGDPPDLVLLDHFLPGIDGLEVLRCLKRNQLTSELPVIMVTGSDSHEIITGCFEAGAEDYVRKPFCAAELKSRVRTSLERRKMLRQLKHQAHYDTLTGLPNRAQLLGRIQEAIDHARKFPEYRFGVLFLDFDRFKIINDSLGHDAGDSLLREIAERLRSIVRRDDLVLMDQGAAVPGRLGGDEFVIVLDDLRHGDAWKVAQRILESLSDIYRFGGHVVYSTASIGVVECGREYTTPIDILRDADTAMYEAKGSGGKCCVLFDHPMREKVHARLKIEGDLREALERRQFELYYQPIVSLNTRRLEAFEALIRWRHPARGLVSPLEFIPVAEETQLIIPLGAWVLDEACRQWTDWHRRLGEAAPNGMHVNLSRRQLASPTLVEDVMATLGQYGVPPASLHLEVTESEVMRDREGASRLLQRLRDQGLLIDIDDFGTGYSSLSCLQEIPIDVLKIDGKFIANVEYGRDYAATLHAIITLAQNLNLKIVAEGIETAAHLAMLQSMDCDFAQGYLIGKPMPAAEAEKWIASWADENSAALLESNIGLAAPVVEQYSYI